MTLLEIIALIEEEYKDVTAGDPGVTRSINFVYRDLSKLYTRETVEENKDLVTVADQEVYTLPADSRQIFNVYIEGSRLRHIYKEALLNPRPKGMPKRWYSFGAGDKDKDVKQRFGLDPVPSEEEGGLSIVVAYEPMPADLVEDTDKVKYIPEEKQYLIAWGAIGILAGIEEDYDIAQNFESRYRAAYNELMMEMGLFRESNYPATARQVKQP